MPSTNKTKRGLNNWVGTNNPKRQDFINDNLKLEEIFDSIENQKLEITKTLSFNPISIASDKDNNFIGNINITPVHQISLENKLQTTVNPTVKVVGKNLFDVSTVLKDYSYNPSNGNVVSTVGWWISQPIKTYNLTQFNLNTRYVVCYDSNMLLISVITNFVSANWVLTTPINTAYLRLSDDYGVRNPNIVQIEQGTTATAYEPYWSTETICEGEFLTGDTPRIENGVLMGQKVWEKKVLYGKDYAFSFNSDRVGFKALQINVSELQGLKSGSSESILEKWNKNILQYTQGILTEGYAVGGGIFALGVLDTDTGWTETLNPNSDEVKAFMNGWKSTANNGTRYTAWVSVVDGTTVPTVQSIDYVKANLAPNYEGYQLYYKLATPNELNTPLDNPPILKKGMNTVTFDTGQVRGEVANFQKDLSNLAYRSNNDWVSSPPNHFSHKTESISSVFKNGGMDTNGIIINNTDTGLTYGKSYVRFLSENFDTKATYTVDYTILRSEAPQIGSAVLKYKEGIVDSINGIIEQLPSKQPQSDVLDRLVDLAEYEVVKTSGAWDWFHNYGALFVSRRVILSDKKQSPFITLDKITVISTTDGNTGFEVTDKFIFHGISYVSKNSITVLYKTLDTAIINNIKNYGALGELNITADARY